MPLQIPNIAEFEGADVDTMLRKAVQSYIDMPSKPSFKDFKADLENLLIGQDTDIPKFITDEEILHLLEKA